MAEGPDSENPMQEFADLRRGAAPALSPELQALIDRRDRALGAGSMLFYDEPLHIVKGEGVWLIDADGRRYLDVYNNVPHVGHSHPRVVEALTRQASTLNTNTRYLHETILDYAERLSATFDDPLSTAVFVCTGSEANEVALNMARRLNGGRGVIISDWAYHGNTAALLQTCGIMPESNRGPEVETVRVPDLYQPAYDLTGDALIDAYVDEVRRAIEKLEARGIELAAFLVDTIFATDGVPDVPPEYIRRVVDLVHEAGGLYIADEVQPGFGRTGDTMWGHQHYGVVPDIATMGKPMGNGHPIAGVVATEELITRLVSELYYFNTFGGNPVSCAVGMAVLDVLEEENLMENARQVGEYLRGGLRELAQEHELIGDVRGRGLFNAVEFVEDRESKKAAGKKTRQIMNAMRRRGVLIGLDGRRGNVLKLRPPMPFSRENADQLVETLGAALGDL